MNEADIARLRAALDRKDIPPHVRIQVFNAVCSPVLGDPPAMKWRALRAELKAHIQSLRSNGSRVAPAIRKIRDEYYDLVVQTYAEVKQYADYHPFPEGKERWQEWVDKDTRIRISNAMRDAYDLKGVRGRRIVPFAPTAYRADNLERVRRCESAIAAERRNIDPNETGRSPVPVGALILAACRMAERAINKYKEDLAEGIAHPYENPAKVNWQHYCTQAMRQRVRDALKGEPVSLDGLSSFYDEVGAAALAGV